MKAPVSEFSRVISVARIPPKGIEEKLEAKPSERAALAKRFGLVDLPSLKAQLTLVPGGQQTIEVTGSIEAEVLQSCVVTLEPIKSRLEIEVDTVFIPAETVPESGDVSQEAELDEELEYFADGKIDIGEQVAQQLGVGIDPYPRKKGVTLGVAEFGKKPEKTKPFAKLATALKAKKNKDKR